MKRLHLTLFAAMVAAGTQASAAIMFFDFGDTGRLTGGNYNNVTQAQAPIANAIDSTGAPTGVSLNTSGFNPGSNLSGTTTPSGSAAIFDAQATRDNLFGHTQIFGSTPPFPQGTLSFAGLDGSGLTQYNFTIFASRLGATDNRESKYTAQGANSGMALLDASNNAANVTSINGIVPLATGGVTLHVTVGPNNTNANGFFYLGALRIESVTIPEPTTVGLALAACSAFALCRRQVG